MRYFVRSYVTRPTTIRAMTEIPAKTPRPIGRTDNFFPGMLKLVFDESAAAAVPLVALEVLDGVVVFSAPAEAVVLVDEGTWAVDVEGETFVLEEREAGVTVEMGYSRFSAPMIETNEPVLHLLRQLSLWLKSMVLSEQPKQSWTRV